MKAWRLADMAALTDEELNRQSDEIVARIKPLLARRHPGVQGAVLADLLAIWLAGHSPSAEEALLANQIDGVRKLVPLYRERFGTERDDLGFH
jgi:hypothetical protein